MVCVRYLNDFNRRHCKQAKDADKLEPKGVVDKLTCSSLTSRNCRAPGGLVDTNPFCKQSETW